jgi:7-cyano-7-deazaguanine reductase
METHQFIGQSPLGKTATYGGHYTAELLFPVARAPFRESLGVGSELPFYGHDLWNAYEFSWLNPKGKPISAVVQFLFPCATPNIIESKSFKLYLNSFHQTRFDSLEQVTQLLQKDLSACVQGPVMLEIAPVGTIHSCELTRSSGVCLDQLDINIDQYTVDPSLLKNDPGQASEILYSDTFKSNCLGTGQPDWGSLQVAYTGRKINHEGLLKYLISYRLHSEFNEHCIERVFMDILHSCQPEVLTVTGRYTRRGGLDTNPCRSTDPQVPVDSARFFRQ